MTPVPFPPRSLEELSQFVNQVADRFTQLEVLLALVVIALAVWRPQAGWAWFGRLERWLRPVTHHPARQLVFVALFAIVARAVFLPWLGAPVPSVYDEESMLFQAQTFALGRLANPTPPFWQHFETFYINQIPAYASMYFPGRGAPLLLGLVAFDNAWAGVWASAVFMAVAATWMLQAWVSLPLAFLGGIIVVLRFCVFSFWINSFYGGAFTAVGAFLVLGAVARFRNEPRWTWGFVLAIGASILMLTRPYEGALLCIPVAALLLFDFVRGQGGFAHRARLLAGSKVVLPVAGLLACSAAFLLAYNVATTGSALKTPYTLQRETYAQAPAFLTSPPIASRQQGPGYFRAYYELEASTYWYRNSVGKLLRSVLAKIYYTWNFYIGATFSLAFIAGLWACRRSFFLLGGIAFFMLGFFLETWNFPQYTAPLFPLMLVVLMRGIGWLRSPERTRPAALFLARAAPASAAALLLMPASSLVLGWPERSVSTVQGVCCTTRFDALRPALISTMQARPGKDLVLVRDGPHNPTNYELVFNEPDIEQAEIVWAHRLGPLEDQKLLEHFAGRQIWEFEWLPEASAKPGENYRFMPLSRPGL
jgi:hypothetical protein